MAQKKPKIIIFTSEHEDVIDQELQRLAQLPQVCDDADACGIETADLRTVMEELRANLMEMKKRFCRGGAKCPR